MTAAHELAEREFEVTVLEARPIAGGKARSMPVPGSGTGGRRDLPGEHGFRFFPGFYRHVPDTMRRIPFADERDGVLSNLVPATRVQIARAGGAEIITAAHLPGSLGELDLAFRALFAYATELGISPGESAYFVDRLLQLLTSCEARRFAEYEHQSWWEFSGAQTRSAAYGKFLADGLTRTLVAAKAREMSARTGGYILLQLLFDLSRPGGQADRVLTGPTNDVWIDPWLAHLRSLGVDYRHGHQVQAIHCADGRISGVGVVAGENSFTEQADFYVAALPVEVMRLLVSDELAQAEPRLAGLHRLRTRWMNGIMFYLDRDVPLVHGHTVYIDSPWALTSISQAQFWPGVELEEMGDGRVEGILSVDVSDWEAPGIVHGKQAMYCSEDEVRQEVWAQLEAGLEDAGIDVLAEANVVASFLDPSIVYPNPTAATNLEPLLINTAGLLGGPARGGDGRRQPLPRRRLRPHAHRPGDDGGRQRGRPSGRQRHPRTVGLERASLSGVEALGAGDLRPGTRARPGALCARAPAPRAGPGRRRPGRGHRHRLGGSVRRRVARSNPGLTGLTARASGRLGSPRPAQFT